MKSRKDVKIKIARYRSIFICFFIAASMFFISVSDRAFAADIEVNSTDDTAAAGDGDCTLREAINNAESNSDTTGGDCDPGSGPDTITFSVSGTITLGSTLPSITSSDGLTIDGGDAITISGDNTVRVLLVNAGAVLAL